MTRRVLPPSEWPKLVGTEAESVWPLLNPERDQVLVVEDGNRIVGCWVLYRMFHAECLWEAPEFRGKPNVSRHLWTGMKELARQAGADRIWTAADSDDVRDLLKHVNARQVPGDHFVMSTERVH